MFIKYFSLAVFLIACAHGKTIPKPEFVPLGPDTILSDGPQFTLQDKPNLSMNDIGITDLTQLLNNIQKPNFPGIGFDFQLPVPQIPGKEELPGFFQQLDNVPEIHHPQFNNPDHIGSYFPEIHFPSSSGK